MRSANLAIVLSALLFHTGCGVETAATATTIASAKVAEAKAAKKTLARVRTQLDAARKAAAPPSG